MLQEVGFGRLQMAGYTGLKSSPYTEGALIYGEKPAAGMAAALSPAQEEPSPTPECDPGPT